VEDVGPWSQYAKQWDEALEHFVSTHYPEELRGKFDVGGTVVVTMNNSGLDRSSSVSVPVRIAQSSGVRSVDDAAVKLISDPAIPWPKFPPELATKFKIAIVKRTFDFTGDE
jgi:outer membrane biosynthesis protein TonB